MHMHTTGHPSPIDKVRIAGDNNPAIPYMVKTSWPSPPLTIPGDLDDDDDVDGADRNILRGALRTCVGDGGFLPGADYDGDTCITYNDYRMWYGYYRAYNSP